MFTVHDKDKNGRLFIVLRKAQNEYNDIIPLIIGI